MIEPKAQLLLVDDEPDLVKFLKWQLEQRDYAVDAAYSGAEALKMLEINKFDVLIADIRMPGIDGLTLIQKAMAVQPLLQCIVITGHGGVESAVEAMRLGAINYLNKPVRVDELDVAVTKGIEKLELIRELERKRHELERAYDELKVLHGKLEKNLEKETQDRIKAQEELKGIKIREAVVEVMMWSMRLWKQDTGKSKIELCEESGIWNASIDKGGTYRTRTLDKYMKLSSIPENPRLGDVLDTAYFVLSACAEESEVKSSLSEKTRHLEKLIQQTG